ncbi:MAG: capsule assembly Wzi family protein [Candidatus Sulfotelmatobacter sp.]
MTCLLASTAVGWAQSRPKPAAAADLAGAGPVQEGPDAGRGSDSQQPADAGNLPDNPQPAPGPGHSENTLLGLPRQLMHDQIGMWTSPARFKLSDATWLVPAGGFAAALLATDSSVSRHLSNNPNTLNTYRHVSDYGTYSMVGGAAGVYLLGVMSQDPHQRETGFLSGEAAIDGLAVVEALKYATGRQRPFQDSGDGKFLKGGTSFPSEHAEISWAIAGIFAHEYPSPFMKFLAYGAATAISATRVTAKQHFPADVFVGAAIGYLTSEYVYRKHHSADLPGAPWEIPAVRQDRPGHWQAKDMGSPYVPLDNWVYPALDRLTAMGYIHTGFADMRPWTRMECARQIEEAGDSISQDAAEEGEAARMFGELQKEFAPELNLLGGGDNADVRVESVYTRGTEIAGKPLTDAYHFGQTIVNDFGRPEEQGFNDVAGMSGWAADGPFVVYARGEYQHAPSAPALPVTERDTISSEDFSQLLYTVPSPPTPPATATPAFNEGRFLDAYVGMNFSDWQITYGNQSLWWGPSQAGPLMFSDNAQPMRMFRVDRVTPFRLPGFLGVIGPMRIEGYVGQYSGYDFVLTPTGLAGAYGAPVNPQPIDHGQRISFKPTSNLEIGLSRTTDYGGPGYPLTLHNFFRSVFSTGNSVPGNPSKPGARRSGLDFSYRLPGVRNGATFYAEGMAQHDEITPLLGPDVACWFAGLYLPTLPGTRKMDLRLEGGYTDPPHSFGDVSHGAFYWDGTWITGFQNAGHLMGSWMGRQGQGEQASTTYWLGHRDKLQFGFRHQKVSTQLVRDPLDAAVPEGGNLSDANVRAEFWAGPTVSVAAMVQYETWNYPVIALGRQSNVTSMIELSFWPKPFRAAHTDGDAGQQ